MAKISLTKFNLKVSTDTTNVQFNGQDITIRQYIPVEEKIAAIERIINAVVSTNHSFYNPIEVEIRKINMLLELYTNIALTQKQKDDVLKTYDLLVATGLDKFILDNIPSSELEMFDEWLHISLNNIYTYHNSIYGILETINKDYGNLALDASVIKNELAEHSDEIKALQDLMGNK